MENVIEQFLKATNESSQIAITKLLIHQTVRYLFLRDCNFKFKQKLSRRKHLEGTEEKKIIILIEKVNHPLLLNF